MNTNKLAKIMPRAPIPSLSLLVAAMSEFSIDNALDQAMFCATVGHESSQLNTLSENLNYSADALGSLFKKYFPDADLALRYARQPEKIANRIYANRGGNSDEISGDGWRYRGAGAIQLTFYDNQAACAKFFGKDVWHVGDWLRTPEGACRSAAWYWASNNLRRFSAAGDFDGASDAVNRGHKTAAIGDSIGWADRLALFNAARKVLA